MVENEAPKDEKIEGELTEELENYIKTVASVEAINEANEVRAEVDSLDVRVSKLEENDQKEEVFIVEDKERGFEIGMDEAWKGNLKRTYDAYQDVDLVEKRRSQDNFDRLNNVAAQALQNAVETANMVAKQAIRQSDVACDAQWNPVQQGAADTLTARAVSIDDTSLKAIGAVVAAAVANALAPAK